MFANWISSTKRPSPVTNRASSIRRTATPMPAATCDPDRSPTLAFPVASIALRPGDPHGLFVQLGSACDRFGEFLRPDIGDQNIAPFDLLANVGSVDRARERFADPGD